MDDGLTLQPKSTLLTAIAS